VIEDELTDPLVLTADDKKESWRDFAGKGIERDIPAGVKGGDGVTGVEGLLDIGDGIAVPGNVEEFNRPGGNLAHRRVDLGDPPGRKKNVMKSKYFRGTENGADVVGILNIVEEKDAIGLKAVCKGHIGITGGLKDGVLVLCGSAKLVQATLVGEVHGNIPFIKEATESLQSGTGGALLVEMRFEDAPAPGTKAFKGRVEAIKEFGGGGFLHPFFFGKRAHSSKDNFVAFQDETLRFGGKFLKLRFLQ